MIMIPNHNFHSGGLAPPIKFVQFFLSFAGQRQVFEELVLPTSEAMQHGLSRGRELLIDK